MKSVALAGLAEPSFHIMYLKSLLQVVEAVTVEPELRKPALLAAVVNVAVPKIIPDQDSQT